MSLQLIQNYTNLQHLSLGNIFTSLVAIISFYEYHKKTIFTIKLASVLSIYLKVSFDKLQNFSQIIMILFLSLICPYRCFSEEKTD